MESEASVLELQISARTRPYLLPERGLHAKPVRACMCGWPGPLVRGSTREC